MTNQVEGVLKSTLVSVLGRIYPAQIIETSEHSNLNVLVSTSIGDLWVASSNKKNSDFFIVSSPDNNGFKSQLDDVINNIMNIIEVADTAGVHLKINHVSVVRALIDVKRSADITLRHHITELFAAFGFKDSMDYSAIAASSGFMREIYANLLVLQEIKQSL